MLKEKKLLEKFEFETLKNVQKPLNAIYYSPKTRSVKAVNKFRKYFLL